MHAESMRTQGPTDHHISSTGQCCNRARMYSVPLIEFAGNRRVPFRADSCKSSGRRCMKALPCSLRPSAQSACKFSPTVANCQLTPKFSPAASATIYHRAAFEGRDCKPPERRAADLFDSKHELQEKERLLIICH